MKYIDRDYSGPHNPRTEDEPELVLTDLSELSAVRSIMTAVYGPGSRIITYLDDLMPYRDGSFHIWGEDARQIRMRTEEVAARRPTDMIGDPADPLPEELVIAANRLHGSNIPAQRLASTLEFVVPADVTWQPSETVSYA